MTIYNIAKTVVLNPAGQVLLLRRSQTDDRRPGQWDFPGGHVEDGEDIIAAAVREAQEEAGLDLAPETVRVVYAETKPHEPEDKSITRFLLLTRLAEDQAITLSFEHDEYEWVSVKRAIEELAHTFYGQGLRYAYDHSLLAM